MKVIVCTYLEGVSGITSFHEQCYPGGRYYEQAKDLLTGEINAAVEGMLEKNITEILIFDGHGAGAVNIGHQAFSRQTAGQPQNLGQTFQRIRYYNDDRSALYG